MGQVHSCFRGAGSTLDDGQPSKDPTAALPSAASEKSFQNNVAGKLPKFIGAFEDAGVKGGIPTQVQPSSASNDSIPAAAADTNSSGKPQLPNSGNNSGNKGKGLFDPHKTLDESLGHPEEPNLPHNPHQHGPPRPPCEDQRLAAADQVTKFLDAAPKKELENILHLVCNIFKVDNALIALFGDRRIYILNTVGGFKAGDFPWRWSFCGWTMASEQHTVMVINDALQDARFSDNKYVQEIGVRFYCGSPLVSSTGHRLGTLCFADTQPRMFDTSSLQILANFSELVTRELEKDIALAQQQQQQEQAAAVDRQQQYDLLLRTVDCVTSAVLLVDTSKPDWPIIHANSGWERLQQQCCHSSLPLFSSSSSSSSSRHLGYLTDSSAGGLGAADPAKQMPINCCFADVTQPLASTPEEPANDVGAAAAGAPAAAAAAEGSSCSSSGIVGLSLWSLVDPHLLQQISGGGSSSSSSSSGSGSNVLGGGGLNPEVHYTPGDQVVQQVKGRQSFTLRGVKLAHVFGGASAQMTFRCAGFSMLEGAVNICLPAFCPDTSELSAAAAALSAKNPSHKTINPTVAPGDSLYFVTIKLHQGPKSSSSGSSTRSAAVSSVGSSVWTNSTPTHDEHQMRVLKPITGSASAAAGVCSSSSGEAFSVMPCMFPQFGGVAADAVHSCQQQQQQGIILEPLTGTAAAAASSRAAMPHNLVVISQVSHPGGGQHNSQTNSQTDSLTSSRDSSFDMAVCADSDSFSSSSKSGGGGGMAGGYPYMESSGSSLCAGLVCSKIAGLALGGQIAAGSYGRVYRGDYFGSKVAVKVLDGHAVLHRDEATGFCLEALLSEQLRHPNIIRTLAWAVITGKGKLPPKKQLWGETLDPEKPSVATNKITAKIGLQQQQQAVNGVHNPSTAAAADGPNQQYAFMNPDECTFGSNGSSIGCVTGGAVTNGTDNMPHHVTKNNNDVTAEDLEDDFDDVSAGQTWMVMEYADKGCLQDAVERGWLRERPSCVSGPINLVAVLATAAEIAGGLNVLHQSGVIHGDLSAFNVMLSSADPAAAVGARGFVAKVADFGLARSLTHKSKIITKTYGTITHMAPEVLEHGMVSKAADVYSFGVLLWQMVTGSRAWAGMSHMAVVNAVCCRKLQLQFPPDAFEGLVLLGQACMSYDPADRPSFSDVLEILEPLSQLLVSTGGGAGGGSSMMESECNLEQQQGKQGKQQQAGEKDLLGVETL